MAVPAALCLFSSNCLPHLLELSKTYDHLYFSWVILSSCSFISLHFWFQSCSLDHTHTNTEMCTHLCESTHFIFVLILFTGKETGPATVRTVSFCEIVVANFSTCGSLSLWTSLQHSRGSAASYWKHFVFEFHFQPWVQVILFEFTRSFIAHPFALYRAPAGFITL